MKQLLSRMGVARKLALIGLTASVPFVAITLNLLTTSVNKDIRFGRWEKHGNAYQRPLETLLESIPVHGLLAGQHAAGDKSVRDALVARQSAVDRGFVELEAVHQALGHQLQFTDAGLAQRKREHVKLETVRQEWEALKSGLGSLTADAIASKHTHLVSDIRTMITHAGDTSNLILDPDLDSYYLMDVTLVALPQTQDRLGVISAFVDSVLRKPELSPADRTQIAVYAALFKEADLDRIAADVQTALSEDANFNGVSETLQKRLPEAHRAYATAGEGLVAILQQCADAGKTAPAHPVVAEAVAAARRSSFEFWTVAVTELDVLLDRRIAGYVQHRTWSLLSVGLGLVLCTGLVAGITRSITAPLREITGTLALGSDHTAAASDQVAAAGQTLAEGASEQAASLEETSASLEELTSMIRRNADHSQSAKDLSHQTRHAADLGVADMESMKAAMDAIKSSSADIAKIVKNIDEIAFQTNILALNAAVEAARAGEAGAGFAVVADEVRNLAQRSAQAAKETASLIDDSIRKSENGVAISGKVASSLQEIGDKARQVDELIAQIAGASKEQAQGMSQINTAVTQMDKVTQSTAASAEESASAAQELRTEAANQRDAVARLKRLVDGGEGRERGEEAGIASDDKAPTEETRKGRAVRGAILPAKRSAAGHGAGGRGNGAAIPLAGAKGSTRRASESIPMEGDYHDF